MERIERKSGIELIKIIATFLIVICHVAGIIPCDFNNRIGDILIFVFRGKTGNLGNCIFIVSSAYFLVDSKKTKPEKAIYLILFETLSTFILIFINLCYGDIKYPISHSQTFSYWWFVDVYILYYLIHGYINKCLKNLTKEEHFILVFFSLLLYTVMPAILGKQFSTSYLTSFVVIHIFISYVKKSNLQNILSKKSLVLFFGILYFALVLISYELDVITGTHHFAFRSNINTVTFYNIILLLFITSLIFYVQQNIKFQNNFVNYISSLSLLMFIIHNTPIFYLARKIVWKFFDGLINYNLDRVIYIGIGIAYYIFCILLSIVYKKLFNNIITYLSKVFASILKKICKSVYKKLK